MIEPILLGLLAGACSLVGGAILLIHSKAFTRWMTPLIAFAAGAFLSVSFLDLLPEAVEAVDEPHPVFIAVLVGFFIFFALERFLMTYVRAHADQTEHGDHTESLPLLIVLGDSLHNFLDGIVIALAYVANPALSLATTLAIVAHEIPQEIGDFAILLDRGWTKKRIFLVNLLSSLLSVVGVLVGLSMASFFESSLPYLLAGVGGIFVYIAASDLIPEIHHRAGHRHFFHILIPFFFGLSLIGWLVTKTH